MVKKLILILVLAVLIFQSGTLTTSAGSLPVGTCPPDYTLHKAMDHNMPGHMHAGLKVDLNGDGMICVKELTSPPTIHVHVDNVLP